MKISILIQTLFPDKARGAIEDLRPQLAGIEHEFVVVGPHEMSGPSIVYVRESDPQGPAKAQEIAFRHARGEVILAAADDVRFAATTVAETLNHFAEPERPFPLVVTYPRIVGGFMLIAHSVFGRLTPSFFSIGRRDVEAAGGWIDLNFVAGYGDCDLGFRAIDRGGKVRLAASPFIEIGDAATGFAPTKFNERILGQDYRHFLEKWRHSADPAWGDVELEVNLAIPVHFLPLITNDPRSMTVDGPDAIRDLRILSRLGLTCLERKVEMPVRVAEAALAYLRWVSAVDDDPQQVVVHDRIRASIARPGNRAS